MARSIKQIEEDIRLLDASDKLILLKDLISELDGTETQAEVEKAWMDETERRYKEYKSGEVEAVSATDAFAAARSRLSR